MARGSVPSLLLFALLLTPACNGNDGVVLNEVTRKAAGPDWVEIHNGSRDIADLSGWGLVDDDPSHEVWRFPEGTTLPPDAFAVVRRHRLGRIEPDGFPFGLGETDSITLVDARDREVDSRSWDGEQLPPDRSLGRVPDGGDWHVLFSPSPGTTNVGQRICDSPCAETAPPGPSSKNASLFAERTIVDVDVTITPSDWHTLMQYKDELRRDTVPCDVGFEGATFQDARIHIKGFDGDWHDPLFENQFIIIFNASVPGGRFRGLRRLNLDAQLYDVARIRNNLGMHVMRRLGLRAPRTNHVRLHLNGEYYGLYENIEPIDKEFLEDRFVDSSGNLYDGDELRTNEEIWDTGRFDELVETSLSEVDTAPAAFRAQFEALVQIQPLLRQMAAEAALISPKNFWAKGFQEQGSRTSWNFFLYDEPGQGFELLPWDLDAVLLLRTPDGALQQPETGLYDYVELDAEGVARPWDKIQRQPDWRAAFEEEVATLASGILEDLPQVVTDYCDLIRPSIEASPNYKHGLDAFDAECRDLEEFAEARRDVLGGL